MTGININHSHFYKAQIDTPFGLFLIAVISTRETARQDIYSAVYAEFPVQYGSIKIKGDVQKSNKRIITKMYAIKQALSNGKNWAFIKRI